MDEWGQLYAFLAGESISEESSFSTPCYVRLQHALLHLKNTGKRDLAVLIRGIMRFEGERLSGNGISPVLFVPKDVKWPDAQMWAEAGMEIVGERSDGWLIRAKRWQPDWLPGAGHVPPDQALFALDSRNQFQAVDGDPFLQMVPGRAAYRCAGQRDAIRSILTSPEDATLVVLLPTGSGKSLCAQLPALLEAPQMGITVVVVPTTALAIDQERAMASSVLHPTAYYGDDRKAEVNSGIRERIMDGSQQVVFTSPESLFGSLRHPLRIAAERGYLRYLVLDEAHMVDQWGDGFRSAFQEVAGWRRKMLELSPAKFRTVLLSATVTEHCLDTLETLFAGPGAFQVFSAAHLRPEPAYWIRRCRDEQERETRLLEAVAHLPRPLILYTTKIEDAKHWRDCLLQNGYERCGIVTGANNREERIQVIAGWQKREIDLVVATSAFGLGVDQAEVRAVLHACIPENVDRYYQEVGRGGRDGNASLSLLLYTDQDMHMAKEMNQKKIIGIEKGFKRWSRMFHHKTVLSSDRDLIRVSVDLAPSDEPDEIDIDTIRNKDWNVRTLTLMARTKLIELEWEEQPPHESGTNTRLVRILDHQHLSEQYWEQRMQPYRLKSFQADRSNFDHMQEVLKGTRCIGDILHDVYQIPSRQGETPRQGVALMKSCGGCAACRREGGLPYFHPVISKPVDWKQPGRITPMLQRYLKGREQMILFYDPAREEGSFSEMSMRERDRWKRMLRWFAYQGIRQLVGDDAFRSTFGGDPAIGGQIPLFVCGVTEPPRQWLPVPTLIFQRPGEQMDPFVQQAFTRSGQGESVRIFLLPLHVSDPQKKGRLLKDRVASLKMSEFCQEVGL